jgi:hypothetical protein
MSTLKVDKIVPFQSSSVEIEGDVTIVGGATTGSNDFVGNQTVTGSIDITGEFLVNGTPITGSGGDPIDTSSFATTGSNNFEGDQIVNGKVEQTVSVPTIGSETEFIKVTDANVGGKAYDDTVFSLIDFSNTLGPIFRHALSFRSFDSTAANFGTELTLNGRSFNLETIASGSQSIGRLQLLDLYNGKTSMQIAADTINIAKAVTQASGADTTVINIGVDGTETIQPSELNLKGNITTNRLNVLESVVTQTKEVFVNDQTASIDFFGGNSFKLSLEEDTDIRIEGFANANGQTIDILLISQPSASVSFAENIKQISGSEYVPSDAGFADIITLKSFEQDGDLYITNVAKGFDAPQEPQPGPEQFFSEYDDSDAQAACSSEDVREVWTDTGWFVGGFLYTDDQLSNPADDGYYKFGDNVYELVSGEMVDEIACS